MVERRNRYEIIEQLSSYAVGKLETDLGMNRFRAMREVSFLFGWYIEDLADDISLGNLTEEEAKKQLDDAMFDEYVGEKKQPNNIIFDGYVREPRTIPKRPISERAVSERENNLGIKGEYEEEVVVIPDEYFKYKLPNGTMIIDVLSQNWSEIATKGLYGFFRNHPEFGVEDPSDQMNDFVKIAQGSFYTRWLQKARKKILSAYREEIIATLPYGITLTEKILAFGVNDENFKSFLRERYEKQYKSEMRFYRVPNPPRNADEFVNIFVDWLPDHFPKIR